MVNIYYILIIIYLIIINIMEEEQYDIEQKQDYLRNEILEPGYDPNEFLSFLIAEEGTKGSDLELWSMSELQAVIRFKY